MSTRSIVGAINPDSTFEGLYCHFDGYPTAMAVTLAQIVTRDGAAALPVLSGATRSPRGGTTGSWVSLNPRMPSPDTPLRHESQLDYLRNTDPADVDYGTLALYTAMDILGADARDHIVTGYGTAQTDSPLTFSGTLGHTAGTGLCEWAYLLTDDLTLLIFELADGPMIERERFTRDELAALAANDAEITQRVADAECGKDYSRCTHVPSFHDADAHGQRALA